MLCIDNTHTDACFNIAVEEYFLKNSSENIFMLYRNEPSVIIGKHQQVRTEVNTAFAERNRIRIVRRYSGGGAVFHDPGNLNLTFIENSDNLNFDRFTIATMEMLSALGIDAIPDSRRGLTVNGRKISGSAQCLYKSRALYHATFLFSSDLESLEASLEGNTVLPPDERADRLHVRSVKSPVANISEYLTYKMDISDFRRFAMNHFLKRNRSDRVRDFTPEERAAIEELRETKYSTYEWNYNASAPSDINKNTASLSPARL